jgi:hypothetical protein
MNIGIATGIEADILVVDGDVAEIAPSRDSTNRRPRRNFDNQAGCPQGEAVAATGLGVAGSRHAVTSTSIKNLGSLRYTEPKAEKALPDQEEVEARARDVGFAS